MEINELFQRLEDLLANPLQRPAAIEMLGRLGIIPAASQGAPGGAVNEAAVAAATAAGKKKARERAAKIAELCFKAGVANMAPQLIGEEISYEDAVVRILESAKNLTVQ